MAERTSGRRPSGRRQGRQGRPRARADKRYEDVDSASRLDRHVEVADDARVLLALLLLDFAHGRDPRTWPMRRLFRSGFRVGVVLGLGAALVKVLGARRKSNEITGVGWGDGDAMWSPPPAPPPKPNAHAPAAAPDWRSAAAASRTDATVPDSDAVSGAPAVGADGDTTVLDSEVLDAGALRAAVAVDPGLGAEISDFAPPPANSP